MSRYAVDAGTALRIILDDRQLVADHSLVGAAILRSHASERLYRRVSAGELDPKTGRALLERLAELKIRLLGDRGSRAAAWKVASELGWDDLGPAEYLAVAVLQADALITDDPVLAAAAEGRVRVADYEELYS